MYVSYKKIQEKNPFLAPKLNQKMDSTQPKVTCNQRFFSDFSDPLWHVTVELNEMVQYSFIQSLVLSHISFNMCLIAFATLLSTITTAPSRLSCCISLIGYDTTLDYLPKISSRVAWRGHYVSLYSGVLSYYHQVKTLHTCPCFRRNLKNLLSPTHPQFLQAIILPNIKNNGYVSAHPDQLAAELLSMGNNSQNGDQSHISKLILDRLNTLMHAIQQPPA
jgi:hypothetical protein